MFLPVGIYKNILRLIGFVSICTGLLFGYLALETMLDPSVTIIVNGIEKNDAEAKMVNLILPIILIFVGLAICLSKGETLANMHKIRANFWSIFYGK